MQKPNVEKNAILLFYGKKYGKKYGKPNVEKNAILFFYF
jgi:hypothetical protein|nr:MAG TPA: hypothetical protein [Caudoviricetes sp.]